MVGDDAKADEFEDMSLDEYADHKGITIANQGEIKMPNGDPRSKTQLLDDLDELEQRNEDLEAALSAIYDIVVPQPDEDIDEGDDQE